MSSFISKILTGALSFTAGLTQEQTNGLSKWGTLEAPEFSEFLVNNPLPEGYPWGSRTAEYTNPYQEAPHTGKTRYYNFTVQRGKASPDGYEKDVILINGQFPGPVIEANWGDMIEVQLNNNIHSPEEGTALHYHGLLMKETPWYDGVPSVQQCPIAPGSSFTYRFRADLYGTSWYHSHYSAQYAGGLMGPMIVHGPKHQRYDFDLGPVFLTDWFHKEYFEIIKGVVGTDPKFFAPFSDNNLINGKMDYDCSLVTDGRPCVSNAGLSKFKFRAGKTHRLRLINAGAAGLQHFSIDGHEMTVIANDFVPVVPYTTKIVTMGIGQRTDVLVKAIGKKTDAYWMRSNISEICGLPRQGKALAAIYYDNADTTKRPGSTAQPYVDDGRCANDDLAKTVPLFPMVPNPNPDIIRTIEIKERLNATGNLVWDMNGQTFRANFNHPLLLLANQGNTTNYPAEWNVYNFGNNATIRIVLQNNSPNISHPMHLHGHNMFILHEGEGHWDGHTIINPQNPQRRDTQMLRPGGHMVIQFDTDNPGVWPFHCHVAWHVSGGLYINIMERPDDITHIQIPDIMAQTCTDWDAYSKRAVVDQIDSGLRV